MKIWKEMSRFRKPRNEVGFHCDLMLEEGEYFDIRFMDTKIKEYVPKNKVWKIHFSMAVEEFPK